MKIRLNRLILTTGALLCLTAAPIAQTNPLGSMEVQAAELPYSIYWETQADGSWKYKLNTGGYASGWIQDEVDKNWYYMDESATMQSGVYKSYGKYYLLSEIHDGHYGHLVKNGEVYQGITISASTNADDEGALTDSTLSALRNAGVNVDNVQDVSGTTHTTGGQDVAPSGEAQNNGQAGSSSGNTQQPSGNGLSNGGDQSSEGNIDSIASLVDHVTIGGVDEKLAAELADAMSKGDYH